MKTKIKEVEKYFKSKLLSGDFEIIERSEYTYKIQVDNDYKFTVWMANEPYNRNLYDGQYNYMNFNLNVKESEKLHSVLRKDYNEFTTGDLKSQKMEEFNKLKKELGL